MKYSQSAFLIDSCAYFFRYYFSDIYHHVSLEGAPTGGVYGFANFLLSILEKQAPGFAACCFDEAFDTCFRNELYSEYKANRAPPDEIITFQLQACKEIAELLGFSVFAHSRYEADDLIGSLVAQLQCNAIYIISGDKDFYQCLVKPNVYLWDITKKTPISNSDVFALTEINADQWIDYQTLVGDSVDNIPGVKGVGAKTAIRLLQEFGTVAGILENIERITDLNIRNRKNIQTTLRDSVPHIALSKMLVTIETDLNLIDNTDDLSVKALRLDDIVNFCHQMGLSNLLPRVEKLYKGASD